MRRYAAAIATLALTLALAACGPSSSQAPATKAGASTSSGAQAGYEDDGTPGWVTRGGGAIASDGGGVFYGVGAASNINNPALLRSTADNRAREDLAKVLQVFTASLMKDYASSAGEQAVEQAIKTATSMSLKGVDIVDHYIAGDGTLYSLARLGADRYAEVLRAEELGAAKSYTSKVNVDDMFKQQARPQEPAPAPVKLAAAEANGSTPVQAPSSSSARTRSGEKPAWVDGRDPNFPVRRWLCAVGFGPERTAAENAGYAAIARIFKARVLSVGRDFMGAYSKTGAQTVEMQSSEQLTQVSTEGILSGVEIQEVWSGDGTTYALACMERSKAKQSLQGRIQALEEQVVRQLEAARKVDKAGRVAALAKALGGLREREVLNGELRIVDADGIGMSSSVSHVDVAAAFEAAVEALRVGVVANGPYADDFRGDLIEGLSRRGFKVSEGEAEDMDVLVTATIRMEDGGKGTGRMANTHFARGVIQVEIKNVAQGKVLASLDESKKDGSRTQEEAERRVVRALSKTLTNKVGARIEKAMLR